jgi:hypothetical protein
MNQGLLARLFDSNCNSNMSSQQPVAVANHGGIACAEKERVNEQNEM